MKLDPGSFLAGITLLVLGQFAMSALPQATRTRADQTGIQSTVQPNPNVPLVISKPVEVLGIPTPRQMMRIVEGTPFVVPGGKVFVVTGLGGNLGADAVTLDFNGTAVLETATNSGGGSTDTNDVTSVRPVPPGLVAPAATIISVSSPVGGRTEGQVLGYLADA